MGKVVDRAALVAAVAAEQKAGRTVALANGCFDLLHVGHVRYLEGAAQEADVLVVAINDDASVRTLKGENRPILDEASRAELVAASPAEIALATHRDALIYRGRCPE